MLIKCFVVCCFGLFFGVRVFLVSELEIGGILGREIFEDVVFVFCFVVSVFFGFFKEYL